MCTTCLKAVSTGTEETRWLWSVAKTVSPSRKAKIQAIVRQNPQARPPAASIDDYMPPYGSARTSGHLYRSEFVRPSETLFCQSCAGERICAPVATKLAHGPILAMQLMAYDDCPNPNHPILKSFPNASDPNSCWELFGVLVHHPPKSWDLTHYTALVHDSGWHHVNDKGVSNAKDAVSLNTTIGNGTPNPSLLFYVSRQRKESKLNTGGDEDMEVGNPESSLAAQDAGVFARPLLTA